MIKRITLSLVALAATLLLLMPAAFAQSPVGTWRTIDDETGKPKSHVEIYEQNGKLYGKITKLLSPSEPNPTCKKCSGAKKGKPIEGLVIIEGLKKDGDEWEDGTILDPSKGKTYDCKIWLEGDKLKVRGYVALFYRTQTWQRVKAAQ